MSIELTGTGIAKAIGSAGVVAALVYGAIVSKSSTVLDESVFISNVLVPETRALIKNDTNSSNATSANLITQGRIPLSRVNGSNITSTYGTITVASANVMGNANDGFTVAYPAALTAKECTDLANQQAQYANTITVNATSVKANGANINTTTLTTQCSTGTPSITFGYSKYGN